MSIAETTGPGCEGNALDESGLIPLTYEGFRSDRRIMCAGDSRWSFSCLGLLPSRCASFQIAGRQPVLSLFCLGDPLVFCCVVLCRVV